MAADKETNEKPATKAPKAAAAEVAKVSAGTGDKGTDAPATDQANSGAGGLTQADLDKAAAEAVDAFKAEHAAELDKARDEERQVVLRAILGEGALPPDVREAVDKQLATARKEGFDAGKEEALEELAGEQNEGGPTPPDDDGYDDQQTLMARAILLGIVLRLPEVYRVAGEGPKLDELVDFIDSFESSADRYMAVELMKVLSETKASALASNAYQSTIRNGLKLVHGENAPDVLTEADSQDAAANRLDQAMKGRPNDIPPEAMPRDTNLGAEHQVVTAEQQKAADRLSRATGKH